MHFYLNGKKRSIDHENPAQTVLEYVRGNGLTGSKLGCQEGGCGACTMTVAEWDTQSEAPRYFAINGCLVPLIALDGKHLITVEGIGTSENMHPAQERIAKFHGSQCGFCTPGIVMSLYSLLRSTSEPSKEEISEAFDGNLCRCTGYKPIIDAAYTFSAAGGAFTKSNNSSSAADVAGGCAMGANCCKVNGNGCRDSGAKSSPSEIDFTPNGLEIKKYDASCELLFPMKLKNHDWKCLEIKYKDTIFYRPVTLQQLIDIKSKHFNCKIVSGASEIQIEQKIRGDEHPVAAYVNDIPELKTFKHIDNKGVVFGANISLSDLEHSLERLSEEIGPERSQTYTAITQQLKFFAGRQVRNCATPAGNIATASPIADLNPILVAANATLVVLQDGHEIELPMGHNVQSPFFTSYRRTVIPQGAILLRVFVPETSKGEIVRSYKQAKRKDDDISIVTAAMRATVDSNRTISQCSLVYGGVAPTTVFATTSTKLVGKPLNDNLLTATLTDLDKEFNLPYSVPGGMAVFRRSLILSFFYKFYLSLQKSMGNDIDKSALEEVTRDFNTGSRDLRNEYEQRVVGKSDIHLSGTKQVTGEAIYIDDMPPFHKELHCVQVLSTKAHAKILSVDWSDALDLEGVEGYVSLDDVSGNNQWGIFDFGRDLYFAENNTVQYVGDCIGAVCATTHEVAQKAARLVKVEYEELPHITTIEQAIEEKSFFPIYPLIEKGDPEYHLKNSKYYFEGTARMGAQEHFYLEPQGAIVVPEEGDEYKVYASSQNPTETQLLCAKVLGIPASRVVARVKRLGGGFGGKETRTCHYSGIAAVAAKKFRRPVRIIPSRSDDMLQAGQRHPFLAKWRVALDENYKFTAYHVDLYANAGYSMDLTKGVMDRAVLHVDNCYEFPNCYIKCWPCKTNTASNTAFRGFGGPQGMFSAESIIYTVSERLGIDYELLRERNYYPEKGGITPYKQNLGDDFTAGIMAKQLMKQVKYDELRREVDEFNKNSKWIKRGLAHVPTKFGVSFGALFLNQAGALVHIYEDGSILLSHGGTEMGQGLHTKMAMVCAEELGVDLKDVFISETSTQVVANTSASAASASSDLNGMAIKNACDQLNERLKIYRDKFGPDAPMSKLAHAAYFDRVNLSANGFYKTPEIGYVFGDPNPKPAFFYYTQGNAVSMVEVNTLTGDWANLRTDIVMDIGRTINQAVDYGQIEGAFVQGQGLFTIEESLWFQNGGLFTRGPGNYKIPGFRDIPQHFNISMLQDRPFKHLKTINRSKGIGEPPLFLGCAPMFAIRDAIKSARADRGLDMQGLKIEAPLTSDRIRTCIGDEFVEKAQVEVTGKPFLIRA